jgi:ornithine cyclodeaminase/alanine dehydrogenase-like protein (mu-crystallin family)
MSVEDMVVTMDEIERVLRDPNQVCDEAYLAAMGAKIDQMWDTDDETIAVSVIVFNRAIEYRRTIFMPKPASVGVT